MGWGKIGGLCSLKAIILACFLAPATVTVVAPTPAFAQFNIIIPNFGYGYPGVRRGYYGGGRRYSRSSRYSSRHTRRGGGSGGTAGEVSSVPSGTASTGKGVRGTSD
jgi:hypothetical protein